MNTKTFKCKDYKPGKMLTGELTLKIDGVRAHRENGVWLSRTGKPLYNLPDMPDGIYEVYLGDWASSVSACRTINGDPVDTDNLYMLYPHLDDRLYLGILIYELPPEIPEGIEGFVIHTADGMYKVKHKYTYDVEVTGIQPGTGKYAGKMGALLTPMGKVGTGFTDSDRELLNKDIIGKIIEVECMELTENGLFRHPRFVRVREDKC
jgi:hypothetical protein